MPDTPIPRRPRGRPREAGAESAAGTVQALDRGLMLLAALAREGRASLTELALRVGMPPSTAHRLLTTMQRHGVVDFDEPTQDWAIGVEAFRIGSAFLSRTSLVDSARELLRELMEDTGETANLAISEDGDVVFLSQVEASHPIRAFFRPGARGHMHASGIGKALLAALGRREVEQVLQRKGLPGFTPRTLTSAQALFEDLGRIRARGWSLDDEERHLGMRCVASAVYNGHGEAVAGISVSGPAGRLPDEAVAELGPRVRRAAEALTARIGGAPPPPGL